MIHDESNSKQTQIGKKDFRHKPHTRELFKTNQPKMFQPLNVARHFFCNIFGYDLKEEEKEKKHDTSDNESDDGSEYSLDHNWKRQLRGEYTEEEQKMVDRIRKNQTSVELVVFQENHGTALHMQRIHPDMDKLTLAESKVKAPEDVKAPRFWEKLRFTSGYHYEKFLKMPLTEDLKFYWYNHFEWSPCGTCNDDLPRVKETSDQYTPIPIDQVSEILDLIKKHLEDEIPKPVELPLVLNVTLNEEDSKVAKDNYWRNFHCSMFMGQVFKSTKPQAWSQNYRKHGCALIPLRDDYYALVVTSTELHLHPIENNQIPQEERDNGMVSWQRLKRSETVQEWKRDVKDERQINGQLFKDGFEPLVPLVMEMVSVANQGDECVALTQDKDSIFSQRISDEPTGILDKDGGPRKPIYTRCTVLPIDATVWTTAKVSSSLP